VLSRYRVVQPQCLVSFFALVFQSCVGVFIQSLMTGLIFSKLARAKQRAHTIMFSRLAVVCKRDAEYQLLFRVADMRRSHIVATSIRALMVKDRSCDIRHVSTFTLLVVLGQFFLDWKISLSHTISRSRGVNIYCSFIEYRNHQSNWIYKHIKT